jgi:hypothetical protein
MTTLEVQAATAAVSKQLGAELGLHAQVTDSATWYREHFARCGDWESWIWDTVTGKDYVTRQVRFKGFIACKNKHLSRANAGIIRLALTNNRAVLFWEPEAEIQAVLDVVENDPEDPAQGWQIYTTALGG